MKHMGRDEKNRIEFMLGCGYRVADIARALGRSESTISRELLGRRIESDKLYGCSNRLCAHFDECRLTLFNGFNDRSLRKNARGCFETCPDFREAFCPRLNRAPYVCNGCAREHNCPLRKRYYVADAAQTNYRGTLTESRRGTQATDEERADKTRMGRDRHSVKIGYFNARLGKRALDYV